MLQLIMKLRHLHTAIKSDWVIGIAFCQNTKDEGQFIGYYLPLLLNQLL